MALPALTSYSVATGQPIHGGRWPGGLLAGAVDLSAMLVAGEMSTNAPTPGTITALGTATLLDHMNQVRENMGPITGETEAQVDARMGGQRNQILDFCGATLRGSTGRYLSLPINAGHSATGDDGFYEYDLETEAWVYPPRVWPSQYGSSSGSTANIYGEYNAAPADFGRPADQHSNKHVVNVGDDIIQAFGYSITVNGASGSRQAHRWKAGTGTWERYGGIASTFPAASIAHCFYESGRNRIVRFPGDASVGIIESIAANLSGSAVATTEWTVHNITTSGGTFVRWPQGNLYKGIGYHPGLDCYVMASPNNFSPRTKVYTCPAADLTQGWTEAVGTTGDAGSTMPNTAVWLHLEYVPGMDGFAIASFDEPSKLYYLRPPASGVITDPWAWTSETFTGTAAAWGTTSLSGGPDSRLRWSEAKGGLVALKRPGSVPELFAPTY